MPGHVVVMVKVPALGRVKTRLSREIGAVRAAQFYRQSLATVVARLKGSEWRLVLAVAPDNGAGSRQLPRCVHIAQGTGDLGQRMQRVMDRLPAGPVIIIGSDIPGVGRRHIRRAFRLLGQHDAVLGPAGDGGYWLVGFKRRPRVPCGFERVRWSGPHALADTMRNLAGLRVAFADQLDDVDEAADLARLGHLASRRVVSLKAS
ncbi:MAG: TIGR04282 family arsenosugar biosynthesis glycosyltransferase [Hyphomicrobium sp.]|jgi:hypothetical protein